MKAILIDAGNTRIRAKAWPGPAARARCERATTALDELFAAPTSVALADEALLRGQVARLLEERDRPPLALVSVVPRVAEVLASIGADLRLVDHRCPLPFASEVEDLAAVGPDRLCNVAAARRAGLRDSLILDAGTATTIDILSDGVFRGGLIAPGMAFAAQRLGEVAARLSPVEFAPRPLEPGRTTADAMAIGAWHVGHAGVETTIRELAASMPRAQIVLTGGLGHHFLAQGRHLDPDWTLRGAAHLAGFDH